MKKYRIESILVKNKCNFIPAQVIGDKKIIRTSTTMSIKQCKEFISKYKQNHTKGNRGKWVLLKIQ